jgi:hypothetical protein
MNPPASSPFTPPTADQVHDHLERHPPRPASPVAALVPLLSLGIFLILAAALFAGPGGWPRTVLFLAALGGLIGMSFFTGHRIRRMRQLEQRVAQVQQLAVLRRWPEALRLAWRVLPEAGIAPEAHGRVVAAIAHVLDQVKDYEAAIVAYDYLIERIASDQPGALQLRAQRAIVEVLADRLTDADRSLRSLRGSFDGQPEPTPASAAFRLASLIQQVRTHHYRDAADLAATLLDDLRPLGVEAGYGHALMALSFHELPDPLDRPDPDAAQVNRREAATWWSRATLLLPVSALLYRFGELAALTQDPALVPATQSATPPLPPSGGEGPPDSGRGEGASSSSDPSAIQHPTSAIPPEAQP